MIDNVSLPTDVTTVPADPLTGEVRPKDIVLALRANTRLVSVMLANNETGIIQPVRGVVDAVRAWEQQQGAMQGGKQQQRVLVHTDAAQVRNDGFYGGSYHFCCF